MTFFKYIFININIVISRKITIKNQSEKLKAQFHMKAQWTSFKAQPNGNWI